MIKYLFLTVIVMLSVETFAKERHVPGKSNFDTTTLHIAKVLGSNMVVQQGKPFKIWGTSLPKQKVNVTVSWNSNTFITSSTDRGDWEVNIPSAKATATPQTIRVIDDKNKEIVLTNILIGEVWVCSGQSNMEMPLDSVSSFPGFPGVSNFKTEIAAANYPEIRLVNIPYDRKENPVADLSFDTKWTVCTPETAKKYSAIAYYFARKIHSELKVPVGLVVSSLGATSCQEWLSKDAIDADPQLKEFYVDKNRSMLYNGKIYPLRNLSIKGFLWDQGEGNRHNPPGLYTKLNVALIKNWRSIFKQGDLPFYYVQMTPYAENFFRTNPWGDNPAADDYARFREDQARIRTTIIHTGMAVNMDIDEITHIHWLNKKPTGERLALLALNNVYHQNNVKSVGPQFSGYKQKGNTVIVNFILDTANGLTTADNKPLAQHFYVAGSDQIFHQATASIKGNTIELKMPKVLKSPVRSVRYAFTNFPVTNLQNAAGLPAEPFRTDDWPPSKK